MEQVTELQKEKVSMLEAAVELGVEGWKIFPCDPGNKQPLTPHGFKNATDNLDIISDWWNQHPDALIGLACALNGLFVVDLDVKNGKNGKAVFDQLHKTYGEGAPFMVGPMQSTPSGGLHIFFRYPETMEVPNNSDQLGQGIDLRSAGYVVMAPSPGYSWLEGHELQVVPLTEAPQWLLDRIAALKKPTPDVLNVPAALLGRNGKSPTEKAEHWVKHYLGKASVGNRNETGKLLAIQLRDDAKLVETEASSYMLEYAAGVPQDEHDPYTANAALATLKSIYTRPPREEAQSTQPLYISLELGTDFSQPPPAPAPDPEPADADPRLKILLEASPDHDGHAKCVLALYPNKFAFSDAYGWLYYNGKYWCRENAELVCQRAIVNVLDARWQLAVRGNIKTLKSSTNRSSANVSGTLALLKSLVASDVVKFDRDPDLLNVNNGVVNLKTGELMPHDPSQLFTYCLPVDYDPEANITPWTDFLGQVVGGGQEMLDWLQVALGYSLTGHTWEEVLFYVYGPTRSGKGTFTETILTLLGAPLSTEVDFQTFVADRTGDTQNFDLAPLKPCRFVSASESNKHMQLNPAKVKALTGGNDIRCAFKFQNHFTYRPQFKIWLSSNHTLNVDVDDDAAWARMRVVNFPNSYLGHEDKTLKARMKTPEVLRGVLRWIVEGAKLWYSHPSGLTLPDAVREATREHREQLDFVQQWLDECAEVAKPYEGPEGDEEARKQYIFNTLTQADLYTTGDAAHRDYAAWCNDNGVKPMQRKNWTQALKRKHYESNYPKKVKGITQRVVVGLKLHTRTFEATSQWSF